MTMEPQGRVLVIDDERGPRESLRMLLKKQFTVACVESVDEGVRALREDPPDVIVMDIRMPGKTGIQGLAEIREIDPHVSVLMLTGYGALETAQEAIRLGANDYVKKPFDAVDMEQAIHRHVQRTRLIRRRERTEKELRALTEKLNEQMASKENMARLGLASSELVHDLKNPLTAVIGYVELLAHELRKRKMPDGTGDGADTSEYLEAIERNVHRCRELTDVWQSLGRTDAANRKPLSPVDLIGDVLQGVGRMPGAIRLDTALSADVHGMKLSVDRLQMFRALLNIAQNAVQAVDEQQGRVVIRCVADGNQAVFTVEDNGCGIPADTLQRIYEPFFTTKAPGRGTGLGLFIAQKVVEDHGGSIQVESEQGHGTRVFIRIPAN